MKELITRSIMISTSISESFIVRDWLVGVSSIAVVICFQRNYKVVSWDYTPNKLRSKRVTLALLDCHYQKFTLIYYQILKMKAASQQLVQRMISDLEGVYSCTDFHEGMSCNQKAFSQFLTTAKAVSKMYLVAHMIPFLLLKRKKVKENPSKEILKLIVGFAKSLLFAGGFTGTIRRVVCLITQNHKFVGYSNVIAAMIAGISLNFQPISRQSQIGLFCLNKTMEVVYLLGKRRNLPITIPYGECIIMLIATGIISYHYMNNKESIRQSYLQVMNKLLENS